MITEWQSTIPTTDEIEELFTDEWDEAIAASIPQDIEAIS
jgi:hypothetical protein